MLAVQQSYCEAVFAPSVDFAGDEETLKKFAFEVEIVRCRTIFKGSYQCLYFPPTAEMREVLRQWV